MYSNHNFHNYDLFVRAKMIKNLHFGICCMYHVGLNLNLISRIRWWSVYDLECMIIIIISHRFELKIIGVILFFGLDHLTYRGLKGDLCTILTTFISILHTHYFNSILPLLFPSLSAFAATFLYFYRVLLSI